MSRAKNPKYESMSLEELKANMEKSKKELEHALHNKNILEQRKKLVERKERSHRLIVKGAEFEKVQADNYILYIHIYVMISELYHLVDIYPDFVTNIFPHPSAQKRIGKSLMHFILQFERDAEKAFFILCQNV